MRNTATPEAPSELNVADFIDGQLGMLSRRMNHEERARVRWYRDRIALLKKQEPAAFPLPAPAEHPGQQPAA